MGNIVRWILGIPVAAVITIGLFVLMMTLIAEEFKPQEKLASASFEINPTVEDIKVIKRETKVQKVKKVVTPPPPPTIELNKRLNRRNVLLPWKALSRNLKPLKLIDRILKFRSRTVMHSLWCVFRRLCRPALKNQAIAA